MSPNEIPKKVLAFPGSWLGQPRAAPAPNPPARGGLMADVMKKAQAQLSGMLAQMFEQADDKLFEFSEKQDGAMGAEFMEGFRQLRRARPQVESRFNARLDAAVNPPAPSSATPTAGLALVDDEQLEEDIAISSMSKHATDQFSEELDALTRRLTLMRGGDPKADPDHSTNPIGPLAVATAFRQAMEPVPELGYNVRAVVYKIFDRAVMARLGEVYEQANDSLAAAGVLSDIKIVRKPRVDNTPAARAPEAADGQPTQAAPAGTVMAAIDPGTMQLLDSLRALATRQQVGVAPGTPMVSSDQVFSAVSAAAPNAAGQVLDAEALRQLLSPLLSDAADGSRRAISGDNQVAIEMISLLFEFILDDHALSSGVRAELARLQLPYLRTAVADSEWFANPSNPARQLLNALAFAGQGVSENEQSPTLALIEETVDQVLGHQVFTPEANQDFFAGALVQFQSRAQALDEGVSRIEQRHVQSASGRERRDTARLMVARTISSILADTPRLPDDLRHIIERPWAHHMVSLALRQGAESPQFTRARQMVEFFAHLCGPTPPAPERRDELLAQQEEFSERWREGLSASGLHESDAQQLEARFAALCDDALNPLAGITAQRGTAPADEPVIPEITTLAQHPSVMDVFNEVETPESGVDPQMVSATGSAHAGDAHSAHDQAHGHDDGEPSAYELANAVKKGQWVEFNDDDPATPPRRLRLSWSSATTGRMLFVTLQGQKGVEITRKELARMIKEGHATMVEDGEVMERAVSSIAERLRARLGALFS